MLLLGPAPLHADDWNGTWRFQTSYGLDSNAKEGLPDVASRADGLARLLCDAEVYRGELPLESRLSLSLRGFTERYVERTEESRQQGEVRLALGLPVGARGARIRLEAGSSRRAYPDSTLRNFRRAWVHASGVLPLGPDGTLRPMLQVWSLDFRRTPRRDQFGRALDLAYERPLGIRWSGQFGLELGGVQHGRASIQRNSESDLEEFVLGPDQRDTYRHLHVSARFLRKILARLQYGLRSQRSNSFGSSFDRHELSWLVAAPLRAGVSLQLYGNLENTHYTDRDLDDVYILRAGEESEAGQDNNQIVAGVSRPLGRHWHLDLRHGWYRNESLLIGTYYSKRILTLSLSWIAGRTSGI